MSSMEAIEIDAENNGAQERDKTSDEEKPTLRKRTAKFFRKYFWEGQELTEEYLIKLQAIDEKTKWHTRFLTKHRRLIGLLMTAIFWHVIWWCLAFKYNFFALFPTRYFMSITMVFGSLIAGMTSEGGGAVAFPVMTLAFAISPSVARDFSLMIQSFGMTAASFVIFWMKIQLEWHSLTITTLGGAIGIIVGLEFVDPYMTAAQKKMVFVSLWFSFAFALFLLNRYHGRRTFAKVPRFKAWKGVILFISGLCGGIFTSFAGSGLDICSFSVLTLFFRVSEKIATPTSVVLMGINTVVGFYWRHFMMQAVTQEAFDFVWVCVPIVVIGAPLGSVIGTHFHRLVLAALIYIIDIVALVGAFVLVPLSPLLIGLSIGIIVSGFIFFFVVTRLGERMLVRLVEEEERLKELAGNPGEEEMNEEEGRENSSDCVKPKDASHEYDNSSFVPT